jgi:cyclopropane fatty-acyl-phospholipid synthase-like methyltransferase
MNEPSAIRFFHVWDTYARVVGGNYMFHRELGAALRAALVTHFQKRPFSMVDLGCGDAATLAPILQDLPVRHYLGADLSQPALALAAQNLSILACPVELRDADMRDALLGLKTPVDVIYSSFALHHLSHDEKATFFRTASQKLAPDGIMQLVDVVREENQPLDAYHLAYTRWLRATMTGLESAEHDAICEHIVHNDFPEPWTEIEAMASAAGLRTVSVAAPQIWHRLMAFVHA